MAQGTINLTAINKLSGWLWDVRTCGFGVRRQTNGAHYYVRYRHGGQQIVRSIGRHGNPWTPDTARAKAKELLGIVATGRDPFAPAASGDCFGVVVDRYLARREGSLRPKSMKEVSRFLKVASAPLHPLALGEIDRRRVASLLGKIEDASGAFSRNRCRSALSGFFSWAIQEGYVEVNPVAGTGKADEGGSRSRVLSEDEIRALWRGLDDSAFSDAVRLLLLTGQRRGEIGALAWSEVTGNAILLPAERTKNHRAHTVPLSRQARAILERQPRRNSTDFVFSDSGRVDWDRPKIALDARIGIAPYRLHDLRRSCASGMQRLGVRGEVIERALNHVTGSFRGVAGIYQRDPLSDDVRSALQRWADHIDQITGATK
jgi:integrase